MKINGIIMLICSLLTLAATTASAQSTYYWVGDVNEQWNNEANWSFSSGGPNSTGTPDAADQVIFDGNSGKCYMNVSTTVESVQIDTGYHDSLVVTADFVISNGFEQNGGFISVNAQKFTITDKLIISGEGFEHIKLNSKIRIDDATLVVGSFTCQSLQFHHNWTSCTPTTLAGRITVENELRYTGNGCIDLQGGTIVCLGNVTLKNNSSDGGGTAVVSLENDLEDQSVFCDRQIGESKLPSVQINKASGKAIFSGPISLNGDWLHTEGEGYADETCTVHFYGDDNLIECGDPTDATNQFLFRDVIFYGTGTKKLFGSDMIVDNQLDLQDGFLDVSEGSLYLNSSANTALISNVSGGLINNGTNYEKGFVIQAIGTNTGSYTYPFKSDNGDDLEFELVVDTSGVLDTLMTAADAKISVGTYTTNPSNTITNTPNPYGILEFRDGNGANAHDWMIDRYWRVRFGDGTTQGFSVKPKYHINIKYMDADLGGNNRSELATYEEEIILQNIEHHKIPLVAVVVTPLENKFSCTGTSNDDATIIATYNTHKIEDIVYDNAITITSVVTHAYGNKYGSIELTASGGSGNYKYLWSDVLEVDEQDIEEYLNSTEFANSGLTESEVWTDFNNYLGMQNRYGLDEGSYHIYVTDDENRWAKAKIEIYKNDELSWLTSSDIVPEEGYFKKFGETGWYGGMSVAMDSIEPGDSLLVSFMAEKKQGDLKAVGLRPQGTLNVTTLDYDLEYAPGYLSTENYFWYFSDGKAYIYENGVQLSSPAIDFNINDVFKIEKQGSTLEFIRNDVVEKTVTISSTDNLYLVSRFATNNSGIKFDSVIKY